MEDNSYLVAVVPKNSREEIRLRIAEFHGKSYADVRVFADSGLPEKVPTGKGVAIAPERLTDLITGMEAIRAELIRRGLIRT